MKRYHYETHDQPKTHLQLFLDAYNHAKRLKTLKELTPYEFICKAWTEEPERFISDPTNHTVGLNNIRVPILRQQTWPHTADFSNDGGNQVLWTLH